MRAVSNQEWVILALVRYTFFQQSTIVRTNVMSDHQFIVCLCKNRVCFWNIIKFSFYVCPQRIIWKTFDLIIQKRVDIEDIRLWLWNDFSKVHIFCKSRKDLNNLSILFDVITFKFMWPSQNLWTLCPTCRNGILLPKLFWPTLRRNCSSDREKKIWDH